MRHCEQHVFVEEIKDHLTDAHIVPSSVHQQQSPQHPELGQSVVTRLNCAHSLLTEQSNADVGGFDHWNIVRTITDRKSDFVELISDYCDNLSLLNGQQPTAHD